MSRKPKAVDLLIEQGGRVRACVAFCEGAPLEALQPGGLMRSFRALTPGGDVLEVLNLAVEHERVKAENVQLKVRVEQLEIALENLRHQL